jgi:hypothetical protein
VSLRPSSRPECRPRGSPDLIPDFVHQQADAAKRSQAAGIADGNDQGGRCQPRHWGLNDRVRDPEEIDKINA